MNKDKLKEAIENMSKAFDSYESVIEYSPKSYNNCYDWGNAQYEQIDAARNLFNKAYDIAMDLLSENV